MDHVDNKNNNYMAGDTGFEPVNDGVKVRCLTAWRIPKALLERVKRIELSQPAWKAGALPLSYTRKCGINFYVADPLSIYYVGQFCFGRVKPYLYHSWLTALAYVGNFASQNCIWWREKDSNLRNR